MNVTPKTYFTPAFIQSVMQQRQPEKDIVVHRVSRFDIDNSASILVTLTSGTSQRLMGHFGLEVDWQEDGYPRTRRMVMKVKPPGWEISAMLNGLAQLCGAPLAEVYPDFKERTGFEYTHGRELEIYQKLSDPILPDVYGTYADPENESYLVLMEYLEEVELLNSVMEPHRWSDAPIRAALSQIAQWHAKCLRQKPSLDSWYWTDTNSPDYMAQLVPLWEALLANARRQLPDLYTSERAAFVERAIRQIPEYQAELSAMPITLVHNDLNPRNACFKGAQFCLYDWELATFHVPQYDVVEFLCFVLDHDCYAQRQEYLEFYRRELHRLTALFSDKKAFGRGFQLAALDFGLHRLGLYTMAHSVSPYPFLPRVINSYFDTVKRLDL